MKRKATGPRFIQLFTFVKRSLAYHGLSPYARCALIELIDRYNGVNNGLIGLGVRELSDALDCSRDAAARALRELDDSGLARPAKVGVWQGRRATEWRLSFYTCNASGEVAHLDWPQRPQSVSKDTKSEPTVRQEGHSSTRGRTQRRPQSVRKDAKPKIPVRQEGHSVDLPVPGRVMNSEEEGVCARCAGEGCARCTTPMETAPAPPATRLGGGGGSAQ